MDHSFRLNGLMLGSASSAGQIEGGCSATNWQQWAMQGHIKDHSSPAAAVNHWQQWQEDTELMAEMGLQCSRMSIEWARLEPQRGCFDPQAVQHYRQEMQLLKAHGIRPMVTLWHFTNPLWFERAGGFLQKDADQIFLTYAEYAVQAFADLADCWITLNEPNVYAYKGYGDGTWPPGEKDPRHLVQVMNALIRCHIRTYQMIHRRLPEAMVGLAMHVRVFDPLNPHLFWQVQGAAVSRRMFQDAPLMAMHTGRSCYPFQGLQSGRYYDFIGLNYYSRSTCRGIGDGLLPNSPRSDLNWEIYPAGIARLCQEYYRLYQAPNYITENGTCDNQDRFRCRFLYDHLQAVTHSGVPVLRYCHWCFLDNWEWLEGMTAHFGLATADSAGRQIKKSGRFYQEIIREGGVSERMYQQYVESETYHH